ncbi:MAG: hypothetical protein J7604_18590 [Sporocytophaga sp.]|uniref:hypothetical protein n=1 Tax=Sporocytophaga sp. TaxID=2231183 RepID=UPI001B0ACCA7|nr:hypothetical protein [Sporocytophaga sp.]MBO9702224.1 hypothetical protein [Sporocytophaga sp.]
MTSDEIWSNLYDKGINEGVDSFSVLQKNVYYYIDFFYYVEMGDFLYNKSPCSPGENHYKPYIDSWKFFDYNKLADLVQEYNNKYLYAFKELKEDESMPTDEFKKRFGLIDIGNKIELEIQAVIKDIQSIYNFIDRNRNEITKGINL